MNGNTSRFPGSGGDAGRSGGAGRSAMRSNAGIKNFFGLYRKECRKVLCSLTFLLYAAAVFAMYYTQFHSELNRPETAPKPGQESYGMTAREVPEILAPRAMEGLIWEYWMNSYVAYPVGFYKEIHLLEKKRRKMAEIIGELTGLTYEELEAGLVAAGDGGSAYQPPSLPEYHLSETMTYERFRELMREADDIIGGGSRYSDQYIVHNFSQMPKTYEEAAEEYRQLMEEDRITGGYARLYCDYVGLMLAVLPVFAAVSLMQLDRRARMEQLVYSRHISSTRLIFARYAALVTVMLLPVLVTAAMAQIKVTGLYPGVETDLFAFARYVIVWMLPSLMTAAAVGMCVTELCSGLLAILLQGAWWFAGVFSGALSGGIGKFSLVVRHNSLYDMDVFQNEYRDFLFNRVFFALFAIFLVALTVVIYEEKRRGRSFGIRMLGKDRKGQPAA
ncbi:MAG: ABC transporter permease [Lachnospiraceae bacterium]|nr:ABC transporter permease [Lachnospiraceae bacterium]